MSDLPLIFLKWQSITVIYKLKTPVLWQNLPRTGVNLFLQVWLSGFVGKPLVNLI